jgi:hypothetical protein
MWVSCLSYAELLTSWKYLWRKLNTVQYWNNLWRPRYHPWSHPTRPLPPTPWHTSPSPQSRRDGRGSSGPRTYQVSRPDSRQHWLKGTVSQDFYLASPTNHLP